MAKRRKRKRGVQLGSDRAIHVDKMQRHIAIARRAFDRAGMESSCRKKIDFLVNAARNITMAETHSYAQSAGGGGLRPRQGRKPARRINAVGNIATRIDDALDAALDKCVR